MANKIKPKRSYTASSVPLTSDLDTHELAINWADGKAYTKNASGNIVSVTLGGGGGGSANIVEAATTSGFPATGASGTLYIATDASRVYRWSGSVYVELGSVGVADSRWDLFLPAAPTGVTATAKNAQATVSWTAPTLLSQTPITDYIVQYSSNSGSTWTTFSDGTSTATTATVTGLTNGTSYTFRVATVSGVGVGSYSTASSAVTPIVSDPYFSSVALLLHLDGNITDTSGGPRMVTESGFASSTSQSKWGAASRYNGGSSAYLEVSSFPAIGTGDYVMEAWVYRVTGGAQFQPLFDTRSVTGSGGANFGINTSNGSLFADGQGSFFSNTTGSVSTGQWSHVVFARASGTLRAYINGVLHGSATSSVNHSNTSCVIGSNKYTPLGVEPYQGYLSDVRITVGNSRGYTGSTITVPTAAFPNS
jgi:hypothetical protein